MWFLTNNTTNTLIRRAVYYYGSNGELLLLKNLAVGDRFIISSSNRPTFTNSIFWDVDFNKIIQCTNPNTLNFWFWTAVDKNTVIVNTSSAFQLSPEHGKILIYSVNRWIYNTRYNLFNSSDNIIRLEENTPGILRLLFNYSSNQFEALGGILFLKNNSLDLPTLWASGVVDTVLGSDKQWRKIRNNDFWDNTIQGIKMVDNSILGAKIWDASIWGAKLINGTITSTQMGVNSVGTNAIIDFNITTSKIANDAITTGKIFNNSITGPKILDGQVSYAK